MTSGCGVRRRLLASSAAVADPFAEHLGRWIGAWPPAGGLTVVGHPRRNDPGWDGRVVPFRGVRDGARTLVAVPPGHDGEVRDLLVEHGDAAGPLVAERLGLPPLRIGQAVFRWTHRPAPLPALGTWVGADDPRLPEWLRPFNGGVLATFDDRGLFLGAVGRKIHDDHGHEIAVGTTPAARGRGIARRLVVTAARRILAEGAVPTYLHDPANTASARVAVAAGFPDRGWRLLGLWPRA